jgi:hypothetical protein
MENSGKLVLPVFRLTSVKDGEWYMGHHPPIVSSSADGQSKGQGLGISPSKAETWFQMLREG